MKTATLLFLGFLQDRTPNHDLYNLHDEIGRRFHDRRQHLVELNRWDADPDDVYARWAAHDPRYTSLIGFSYGVGWGMRRFLERLNREGRMVDRVYCIDGVPRWRFPPLRWLSLTRYGKIELPGNVEHIMSWRQLNDTPYGRIVHGPHVESSLYCFGSATNLRKYRKADEQIIFDPTLNHYNIARHPGIRKMILGRLGEELN